MKPVVVIHGPQGCGKTRHAQALARHFGCEQITDDWSGHGRLEPGTLALTNATSVCLPDHATVMSLDLALRDADLLREAA